MSSFPGGLFLRGYVEGVRVMDHHPISNVGACFPGAQALPTTCPSVRATQQARRHQVQVFGVQFDNAMIISKSYICIYKHICIYIMYINIYIMYINISKAKCAGYPSAPNNFGTPPNNGRLHSLPNFFPGYQYFG